MLMKLEISFFQNPEIFEEKTTCFVFSLFRALEKLQVQEQDSIFGKFAAAVSCGASRLPLHTFREMVLRTLCLKRGYEQELYTFFPLNNYRLTIMNNLSLLTLYDMYPFRLPHRLQFVGIQSPFDTLNFSYFRPLLCKLVGSKHVKLFNKMRATEMVF